MSSALDGPKLNSKLIKSDYLTESLLTELQQHYPISRDLTRYSLPSDVTIDKELFEKYCRSLFPHDRVFLNHDKSSQMIKMYASHWNNYATQENFKKFHYAYLKTPPEEKNHAKITYHIM